MMLYLEDFLEMIEHLPQELRDRFTEIREMDLQVQNAQETAEEDAKQLFLNAKKMKPEQRDAEFERIRQAYYKALEDADEKVQIATQMSDLVNRYERRLDQEIQKFKMELEADNPGITEVLERRSLELDNPPPTYNSLKPEKRKYQHHQNQCTVSQQQNSSGSGVLMGPSKVLSEGNLMSSNSSSSSSSSSSEKAPPAINYGLGACSNPIAAAASQAIAATQQQQQGRRTASLKASYEAVNSALSREFTLGARDIGSLTAVTPTSTANSVTNVEPVKANKSKKSRQSQQQQQQQQSPAVVIETTCEDSGDSALNGGDSGAVDWTYDPNEPRYCICNQVSYGDMVACDNEDCPFEWFHYPCVGITQPPKGKWYCPQCQASMRRRGRKEKST